MPLNECNVLPFMLFAAIPVEAVTPTRLPPRRSCSIIYFRRKDFPVPAEPVRKIFYPRIHFKNQSY